MKICLLNENQYYKMRKYQNILPKHNLKMTLNPPRASCSELYTHLLKSLAKRCQTGLNYLKKLTLLWKEIANYFRILWVSVWGNFKLKRKIKWQKMAKKPQLAICLAMYTNLEKLWSTLNHIKQSLSNKKTQKWPILRRRQSKKVKSWVQQIKLKNRKKRLENRSILIQDPNCAELTLKLWITLVTRLLTP